jgi:hypothetical protein
VRADDDRPLRIAALDGADHIAEPAGHLLVRAARQLVVQALGQRAGLVRAGRARPERDLLLEQRHRRGGVEPVGRWWWFGLAAAGDRDRADECQS